MGRNRGGAGRNKRLAPPVAFQLAGTPTLSQQITGPAGTYAYGAGPGTRFTLYQIDPQRGPVPVPGKTYANPSAARQGMRLSAGLSRTSGAAAPAATPVATPTPAAAPAPAAPRIPVALASGAAYQLPIPGGGTTPGTVYSVHAGHVVVKLPNGRFGVANLATNAPVGTYANPSAARQGAIRAAGKNASGATPAPVAAPTPPAPAAPAPVAQPTTVAPTGMARGAPFGVISSSGSVVGQVHAVYGNLVSVKLPNGRFQLADQTGFAVGNSYANANAARNGAIRSGALQRAAPATAAAAAPAPVPAAATPPPTPAATGPQTIAPLTASPGSSVSFKTSAGGATLSGSEISVHGTIPGGQFSIVQVGKDYHIVNPSTGESLYATTNLASANNVIPTFIASVVPVTTHPKSALIKEAVVSFDLPDGSTIAGTVTDLSANNTLAAIQGPNGQFYSVHAETGMALGSPQPTLAKVRSLINSQVDASGQLKTTVQQQLDQDAGIYRLPTTTTMALRQRQAATTPPPAATPAPASVASARASGLVAPAATTAPTPQFATLIPPPAITAQALTATPATGQMIQGARYPGGAMVIAANGPVAILQDGNGRYHVGNTQTGAYGGVFSSQRSAVTAMNKEARALGNTNLTFAKAEAQAQQNATNQGFSAPPPRPVAPLPAPTPPPPQWAQPQATPTPTVVNTPAPNSVPLLNPQVGSKVDFDEYGTPGSGTHVSIIGTRPGGQYSVVEVNGKYTVINSSSGQVQNTNLSLRNATMVAANKSYDADTLLTSAISNKGRIDEGDVYSFDLPDGSRVAGTVAHVSPGNTMVGMQSPDGKFYSIHTSTGTILGNPQPDASGVRTLIGFQVGQTGQLQSTAASQLATIMANQSAPDPSAFPPTPAVLPAAANRTAPGTLVQFGPSLQGTVTASQVINGDTFVSVQVDPNRSFVLDATTGSVVGSYHPDIASAEQALQSMAQPVPGARIGPRGTRIVSDADQGKVRPALGTQEAVMQQDNVRNLSSAVAKADSSYHNQFDAKGEDMYIKAIVQAQGFDAKPHTVTKSEMDKLIANGHEELYRGAGEPQYAQAFIDGDFFTSQSGNVFGQGSYFGSAGPKGSTKREAQQTAQTYGPDDGSRLRAVLRTDARVIDYDKGRDTMDSWRTTESQRVRDSFTSGSITQAEYAQQIATIKGLSVNVAYWAASQGYDAIRVPQNRNNYSMDSIVVVNRSSVIVQEKTW